MIYPALPRTPLVRQGKPKLAFVPLESAAVPEAKTLERLDESVNSFFPVDGHNVIFEGVICVLYLGGETVLKAICLILVPTRATLSLDRLLWPRPEQMCRCFLSVWHACFFFASL